MALIAARCIVLMVDAFPLCPHGDTGSGGPLCPSYSGITRVGAWRSVFLKWEWCGGLLPQTPGVAVLAGVWLITSPATLSVRAV